MMTRLKITPSLGILAIGLILSACGSTVRTRTGSPVSQPGNPILASQAAYCSVDISRDNDLGFKLRVFQSPSGQVYDEWVRVKIIRLGQTLAQNPQNTLSFTLHSHKSNQLDGGTTGSFYLSYNGKYVGPYTSLTLGQLLDLARTQYGYPGNNVLEVLTYGEFLLHVPIDKVVMTLKVGQRQAQALIPVFEANPNQYAQTRPSVLHPFHPLRHLRGQSGDEAFWQARIQELCF